MGGEALTTGKKMKMQITNETPFVECMQVCMHACMRQCVWGNSRAEYGMLRMERSEKL